MKAAHLVKAILWHLLARWALVLGAARMRPRLPVADTRVHAYFACSLHRINEMRSTQIPQVQRKYQEKARQQKHAWRARSARGIFVDESLFLLFSSLKNLRNRRRRVFALSDLTVDHLSAVQILRQTNSHLHEAPGKMYSYKVFHGSLKSKRCIFFGRS